MKLDTRIIGERLANPTVQMVFWDENAIVTVSEYYDGGGPWIVTVNEIVWHWTKLPRLHSRLRGFKPIHQIDRIWVTYGQVHQTEEEALQEYHLITKDYAAWKMSRLL